MKTYFEASLATNSKATDNDKKPLQDKPKKHSHKNRQQSPQGTVRFMTKRQKMEFLQSLIC